MLSSIWRPRPGKRRSSSRTMRRKVFASTSSSVSPPVNRRADWPEKWTRGKLLSAVLVDCGAQPRRRHRQVAHANADRVVDRVGDGRHWRHDRHLADTAGAERMPRVRVLDHDGVDHRHVGGDRHAIVEKARIFETPVLVVNVLLVQCPADALCHPALDLALDIGGMDRAADILYRGVTQDLD